MLKCTFLQLSAYTWMHLSLHVWVCNMSTTFQSLKQMTGWREQTCVVSPIQQHMRIYESNVTEFMTFMILIWTAFSGSKQAKCKDTWRDQQVEADATTLVSSFQRITEPNFLYFTTSCNGPASTRTHTAHNYAEKGAHTRDTWESECEDRSWSHQAWAISFLSAPDSPATGIYERRVNVRQNILTYM